MPRLPALFAAVSIAIASGDGLAATSIGSLNTAGATPSSGHRFVAQSFIVPAGEVGLIDGTLILRNDGNAAATGTLGIYSFADDGTATSIGAPLASSPVTIAAGFNGAVTRTFNLPVVAGNKYELLVDWTAEGNPLGSLYQSNYYPGGISLLAGAGGTPVTFTGLDEVFQVNFGLIPEPTSLLSATLLIGVAQRRRVIAR